MFLMSGAFRALKRQELDAWNWRSASVLFVCYGWDPGRDGAETLAGRRLVTAMLEAGARVNVLATNRADDEVADNGAYSVTVVPTSPFPSHKVGRAFEMMRSRIPECEGNWVDAAIDAGRRALASMPSNTVIYGRAMPGSSNIVAWHLARLTGTPWVAHFSDEWPSPQVLSNRRRWYAPYKWPLFELWRRRILRDSGALTFTNPHQAKTFLKPHRTRDVAKSFVVTHLGSEGSMRRHPPQFDHFNIVHTGNFYPPGHSSATLIQGVQKFLERTPAARAHTQFIQAGWGNGDMPEWTTRCGLEDVVRFAGRLPQSEVVGLLDSASLLVGVDYARPESSTLLSKLPDYINAKRPILVITAASSAMGRLFNEDAVGLTAHYDSPDEVAERIRMVFDAWQERRLDRFLPRAAAVESFARRRVLAELAGAFVVARRRAGRGGGPE